jgi:hypothetical protein
MKRSRSVPFSVRFDSQIVEDIKGCWIWQGSKTGKGYGSIYRDGRRVMAHRAAWEMVHGPIPANLCICHHCDTPACVNPAHLFLGTAKDNVQDCIAKGRFSYNVQHGPANGKARLTSADVTAIRTDINNVSIKTLARRYGVSVATIYDIAAGRTWKAA